MPAIPCAACANDNHDWAIRGDEQFADDDVALRRWQCRCTRCGCCAAAVAVLPAGRADEHRGM